MNPSFLVLSGDGINCENETSFAISENGGKATILHINEVISNPELLNNYQAMVIPGGFSFGDELGSGKLLALKIQKKLSHEFNAFIEAKKPILGICNGFQVLIKLGVFCDPSNKKITLSYNKSGQFIDKWCELKTNPQNKSPWLKNISPVFELPVRHGEGRIILNDKTFEKSLIKHEQIAFSYLDDVNGSFKNIAGLTDKSGLILGLMPHPEAALYSATSHRKNKTPLEKLEGAQLFKNIIQFIKEK